VNGGGRVLSQERLLTVARVGPLQFDRLGGHPLPPAFSFQPAAQKQTDSLPQLAALGDHRRLMCSGSQIIQLRDRLYGRMRDARLMSYIESDRPLPL
jgi:hypothetical protein